MVNAGGTGVKIRFEFYSDVLDEWTVETLWADTVDKTKNHYRLDNIPFYAPVAYDDIVHATINNDNTLLYTETIASSGNSTVQVVLIDKSVDINIIRTLFSELGGETEKLNNRYFSMNIPAEQNYNLIKQQLDELHKNGIIDYAEPCLAENHQY